MIALDSERKKEMVVYIERGDVFKTGQVATEPQRSDTFGLSVDLLCPSTTGSYWMGRRGTQNLLRGTET